MVKKHVTQSHYKCLDLEGLGTVAVYIFFWRQRLDHWHGNTQKVAGNNNGTGRAVSLGYGMGF